MTAPVAILGISMVNLGGTPHDPKCRGGGRWKFWQKYTLAPRWRPVGAPHPHPMGNLGSVPDVTIFFSYHNFKNNNKNNNTTSN